MMWIGQCQKMFRGAGFATWCIAWAVGAVILATAPARAADDPALAALKQLFQTDPATAFDKSWQMFQAPMKKGDLDGMMAIIRVVEPEAEQCYYIAVMDDILDAAIPVAHDGGKWADLGELYTDRAECASCIYFNCSNTATRQRMERAITLASQAYQRTGVDFPALKQLKDYYAKCAPALLSSEKNLDHLVKQLGPDAPVVQCLQRMTAAAAEGEDDKALVFLEKAVQQIGALPKDKLENAFSYTATMLWLRGAANVLPLLGTSLSQASRGLDDGAASGYYIWYMGCCALAWSGKPDLFLRQIMACWDEMSARGMEAPWSALYFLMKLRSFHYSETDRITRQWISWVMRTPLDHIRYSYAAGDCVRPETPPDIRRALVAISLQSVRVDDKDFATGERGLAPVVHILKSIMWRATPADRPTWTYETGCQLLDAALTFPTLTERPTGVLGAADLFDQAGRKDLAEKARALAASLSRNDPAAQLACALSSAQAAAGGGNWQEAEKQLGPLVAAGQGPAIPLIDATLLLEKAERHLGKTAEADACLAKAKSLVKESGLSAGERMNYLMTFANGTADANEKTQLLEQAKQAAVDAGLPVMQASISRQLAELSLQSGDLAAAKRALLDIVSQQEAKRERLAFDPLLRQQWFADNLSVYRKLLTVAAKTDDATLALETGEKLRARALLDQLAWRKVDLAVHLPKQLRDRLNALAEERKQTYALLQQATGITAGTTSDSGRGTYIPIRGTYIPIRGLPVGNESPKMDAAKLKQQLDDLAKEETALESAIREAVPAYKAACQVDIPSGHALAGAVHDQRGCAAVEYTLTDDGVVAVAIGPGFQPFVTVLPISRDELQQQIEGFRTQLQTQGAAVQVPAQKLYQALISPVEKSLGRATNLMIVADGELQLIPFAALQDREGRYLADRFAIVYAPSLTVALSGRRDRKIAKDHAALIVAAPATGFGVEQAASNTTSSDGRGTYIPIRGTYIPIRGTYMPIRSGGGVSSIFDQMVFTPLPGAKAEGEAVAKEFDKSALLIGKDATKEKLWQMGQTCDVLHIATHGYADPDEPEFSGLLLAGDKDNPYTVLTAQEVYLWNLQARLVTLSACDTGLGKDVEGEGLLGLTRAFIYAGARDVVCSLWPVSDESTKKLMEAFYRQWQNGRTAEQALQLARETLMKDKATAHPFYWAPFVVVRGPR